MSEQFSGEALRMAREAAGLSREELAVAVGRTAQTIYRWERGHAVPYESAITAVARVLGVRPAELTERSGVAR
jgi:transcriptional regulator with XRE-family HTH domain